MVFLLILILLIGTAALVFWNFLMLCSNGADEKEIAFFAYRTGKKKIELLHDKYNDDTIALEKLTGFERTLRKLFHDPKTSEKKAETIQKSLNKLDSGNFDGINFFALPGYPFLRMLNITGDKKYFADIVTLYSNLNGREDAVHDTRYLLAVMVSAAIGGVGFTAILGILMIAMNSSQLGWLLAGGGPVLSVVMAFALYSGVKSRAKRRKAEIMSDFPQIVSEIALLTSSGMEIFKVWQMVCKDRPGALFREMRQTSAELDNGFEPSVAFEAFIRRCGTKDTTRLGASILQNLTRGNAELSRFLTDLSREVWEERKSSARQLGEQAQSKLMLPMMIIFVGILLLIGVPIALGVSNMSM